VRLKRKDSMEEISEQSAPHRVRVATLNGKLRKRIEGLERSLAPALTSKPSDQMMQLALGKVATEDLLVLWELTQSGKREGEWTERESAAVQAVSCAYDREVKLAGYPSVAAFQRSAKWLPKTLCTTR
jgi:hypothetical protein